jgi:hypothetical protein
VRVSTAAVKLSPNISQHSSHLFPLIISQVKTEVGFQRQMMRVMGSLDAVVSAAMLTPVAKVGEEEDI